MHTKELIETFESSTTYKSWHKDNPKAFLAHLFLSIETEEPESVDVGYFNEESELMTTFLINFKTAEFQEKREDKVFKEPGKSINHLDKDKVKVSFHECWDKAIEVQEEKYKPHSPIKMIFILQNLPQGQVWNVTFITQSFKTLNIKINAETGDIVEDGIHEIISFAK